MRNGTLGARRLLISRSKQKGTSFETLIKVYLQEHWHPDVERLTLSGSKDRGDIGGFRVGGQLVALELKNCVSISLAEWIKEAQQEAQNYGAIAGVTCFKRKGKGQAGDQYVCMTLADFLTILKAAEN